MLPVITAFDNAPDRGRGLARDMLVRWALEEVGQPYGVRLVPHPAMKEPAHRALHPFGKIPTYEHEGLALFESGAIVLHLAELHGGLLPEDAKARARAISWMFAALSTVEPPVVAFGIASHFERDRPWHAQRLPLVEERLRLRLDDLSMRLGDAEWLDAGFNAADLLMVQVLRRLRGSRWLKAYPNLGAYVKRGEARPAFQRAFAAQLADFRRSWAARHEPSEAAPEP